jgi:hypothetical protein
MIGHSLTNTNESTTIVKGKNFRELNTPLVVLRGLGLTDAWPHMCASDPPLLGMAFLFWTSFLFVWAAIDCSLTTGALPALSTSVELSFSLVQTVRPLQHYLRALVAMYSYASHWMYKRIQNTTKLVHNWEVTKLSCRIQGKGGGKTRIINGVVLN